MDTVYLDNIKGIDQHIMIYGDARKMAKAKKYTTPLIDTGIMSIYKPNDEDILDFIKEWALDKEAASEPINLRSGVMLKVSPKLIAMIAQYIHEEVTKLDNNFEDLDDDSENEIDRIREMLAQVAKAPKAPKVAKAPKEPKKDEAKKAKIAEKKDLVKELKKTAKEMKKVADVAQKNLEKAENALAKLLA
jgi:hypothetical protein